MKRARIKICLLFSKFNKWRNTKTRFAIKNRSFTTSQQLATWEHEKPNCHAFCACGVLNATGAKSAHSSQANGAHPNIHCAFVQVSHSIVSLQGDSPSDQGFHVYLSVSFPQFSCRRLRGFKWTIFLDVQNNRNRFLAAFAIFLEENTPIWKEHRQNITVSKLSMKSRAESCATQKCNLSLSTHNWDLQAIFETPISRQNSWPTLLCFVTIFFPQVSRGQN